MATYNKIYIVLYAHFPKTIKDTKPTKCTKLFLRYFCYYIIQSSYIFRVAIDYHQGIKPQQNCIQTNTPLLQSWRDVKRCRIVKMWAFPCRIVV